MNAKKAYVETGNTINELHIENKRLKEDAKKLQDSLKSVTITLADTDYFSLENDNQALDYFYGNDIPDVSKFVADKLIETNTLNANGNPLIPYVGTNGTMRINKVKVLNHRWVICDFTDGKNWGQLMIEYFINDDKTVDFTTIAHVLYS
ncbi:hypothetical protein Y10_20870 [Neptunitalea sp. Y10]|uniref:Hydrolase n=1 Tax=Neptunitalea lumnitzerae TaxID=2965509 RepID=A0ABQ5MK02_9FLAO|nr:hypothetical protein Y10_20870 [Neptunitalea sp. Y10]